MCIRDRNKLSEEGLINAAGRTYPALITPEGEAEARKLLAQDVYKRQKLCRLTSTHQAEQLRQLASQSSRVKPDNEQVYYIIDASQTAILEKRQIQFQYYEYTPEKKRVLDVYKRQFRGGSGHHGVFGLRVYLFPIHGR